MDHIFGMDEWTQPKLQSPGNLSGIMYHVFLNQDQSKLTLYEHFHYGMLNDYKESPWFFEMEHIL